jgi:cell wall-associated NlpC family hydrolase
MDEIERQERERVVECAKSWLGTRFHDRARCKGAGVDCAQLPAAVYEEAGLVGTVDLGAYSPQWHMHRREELYLQRLLDFAIEIPGPPLPADMVLFRYGNTYSHGGIVMEWPLIIHARFRYQVEICNVDHFPALNLTAENVPGMGELRPRKFFQLKRWAAG